MTPQSPGTFKVLNSSGQSLIQVLLSLAISMIVILAIMQIANDQTKSLRHFAQKSDAIDLKNFIAQALNDSAVCSWQFAATGAHLDTADLPNQSISFTKLHSGLNADSPVLVAVGTQLSGLVVSSIAFKNIMAAGPPDLYNGVLEIAFDQTTAARSMAPQKIRKSIYLNSAQQVVGCGSSHGTILVPPGPWVIGLTSVTCPSDYQLSSCIAETQSVDVLSYVHNQHLTFTGPPGQITTCSANMTDSDDLYRLLVVCWK
jgi:hypothetical protein